MKQFFKNKLAVVFASCVGLLMMGAVAHAAIPTLPTTPVVFTAGASVSGSSVTISVTNGSLSQTATEAVCFEATPADPLPHPISTNWYNPVAKQTSPVSTAQITSGTLSGQTIPLSISAGVDGTDCFTGQQGSASTFSGSRTFTNVAAGSHTVNVRVTDDLGRVANRSVSFTVAGVPTCSASPATVNTGQAVTFTGANGSTYTWTATGGSPSSGSGSTFTTSYTLSGTKTVTVMSGGQNGTCTVNVQAASAPTCSPGTQEVGVNQTATLTASGGNGSYTWTAAGGSPSSGSGASFSTSYGTQGTKTVTVTSGGQSTSCSVIVGVLDAGPEIILSASPNPVNLNSGPTISWVVSGANNCWAPTSGEPYYRWYWTGSKNPNGGSQQALSHTTLASRLYALTCSNASGVQTTETVTVDTIDSSIGVDISANPASGVSPLNTTLSWTTTGSPTNCSASASPENAQWTGAKNAAGDTQNITNLTQTTDFTITCTKGSETVSDTVTVTVGNPPPGEPWVGMWANPSTVASGGTSVLNWQVVNALSCQALSSVPANAQWTGSKNRNGGNQSITNLTQNTTFTIECYGSTGTAVQASASVTVTPPAPTTGTIVVNSNRPTTWTISGQADYTTIGNQTSVQYNDVPTGSYTINPANIEGYDLAITPASTQSVNAGLTTTFNLEYTEQAPSGASVNISANPTTVGTGGSSLLSWTSDGIEPGTCVASGDWSGSQNDTGSNVSTGGLDETSTFTITCTVAGSKVDTVDDSVTVTVSDEPGPSGEPQCSDGVDNDGDGHTDYPNDPGCDDGEDNSEVDVPGDDDDDDPITECNDGFDNDGDGLMDDEDPGCAGGSTSERGNPDIREI